MSRVGRNGRRGRKGRNDRDSRSRFLSLLLRHSPETIGLSLDAGGWANVSELLRKLAARDASWNLSVLEDIVKTSPKQRFAFSEDRERIRANQGHSIRVELGYVSKAPPSTLFHGTVAAALPSIVEQGLSKMQRHHVHLSPDRETASIVGARRGAPIILEIDAAAMAEKDFEFFCSDNGVWLTESVPPEFIRIPDAHS